MTRKVDVTGCEVKNVKAAMELISSTDGILTKKEGKMFFFPAAEGKDSGYLSVWAFNKNKGAKGSYEYLWRE
jgi:hypothetical protein